MFTITPETQKHSASHFATIPLKPTILSGFKASDPTLPPLPVGSNLFLPFPSCIPGSPCQIRRYSPILPPTASSKIARSPPGWGDGKNYKLSDNFKKPYSYFTYTPSQKSNLPSYLYQKYPHFFSTSPLPPNRPF